MVWMTKKKKKMVETVFFLSVLVQMCAMVNDVYKTMDVMDAKLYFEFLFLIKRKQFFQDCYHTIPARVTDTCTVKLQKTTLLHPD